MNTISKFLKIACFIALVVIMTSCSVFATPELVTDVVKDTVTVVHVPVDGSGDYPTLEDAVNNVEPETTIMLDAGHYELSSVLFIEKTLTIQGAGVDLTTVSKSTDMGQAVIAFEGLEGEHLTIKDINIERTGEFVGNVMVVFEGKVSLENCRIAGGAGNPNELIKGEGLILYDNTVTEINNCVVENNTDTGINVSGNAQATFDNLTSRHNYVGLFLHDESVVEINNGTISENEFIGIFIAESAQVNVVNNSILDNGSVGIYIDLDTPGGEIRDNTLARNDQGDSGTDIRILEKYSPALIGNTCDGKGETFGGGDFNGILFVARESLPNNPVLENNSCSIARCSSSTGSLLSMECK